MVAKEKELARCELIAMMNAASRCRVAKHDIESDMCRCRRRASRSRLKKMKASLPIY